MLTKTSVLEINRVHQLAAASFAVRHDDSKAAKHYACSALEVAKRLPPGRPEADACAVAWGHYGNALRLENDLKGAEDALIRAVESLRRGTGDIRLKADVLSFLGSTLEASRRFADARPVLEECVALRERLGDRSAQAKSLVQLANLEGNSGFPGTAIVLLYRALPMIGKDLALCHAALHNLCWFLVDVGKATTAQHIILEQEASEVIALNPLLSLRRRWLLARVAAALGDHVIAVEELIEIRDAFLVRGQNYDAALCALELALEQSAVGNLQEAGEVLFGVASLFVELGIGREATASHLLEDSLRSLHLVERLVPRVIAAVLRQPLQAQGTGVGLTGD